MNQHHCRRNSVGHIITLITMFSLYACGSDSDNNSVPVAPSFDASCLPLAVSGTLGGWGQYTFDNNGDMLLTAHLDVMKLSKSGCTLSTVSSGVTAETLLSIAYDSANSMIYVGAGNYGATDSAIYKVNPTSGASTKLVDMAGEPNSLAIAPAGFGSHGGQIIAALSSGDIYAVNQSAASPTPVLIGNTGAGASSIVFGSDNTLYIAPDSANVITMTAAGVTSTFATGMGSTDGLAIDDSGNRLFIADAGLDQLHVATIPGGTVTTLGAADFDSGFWPSPMIYHPTGQLFRGLGESSLTIDVLTP